MLTYSVTSSTGITGQAYLNIVLMHDGVMFGNLSVSHARVNTFSLTYDVRGNNDRDKVVLATMSKLSKKFDNDRSLSNMLKEFSQVVYDKQLGNYILVDGLKRAVNENWRLFTFPKVDWGWDVTTYAPDEVGALDWLVKTQPNHVKKAFLERQEIIEGGLPTLDNFIELEF